MKLPEFLKKDKVREALRYGKAIKNVLRRKAENTIDESENKIDRKIKKIIPTRLVVEILGE